MTEETYFYDIESFPTYTCVTFKDKETCEVTQFQIGCGHDELRELQQFVRRNILLVGFNNISYDDAVLRYLILSGSSRDLPAEVFKLSGRLIDFDSRRDDDIRELRYPRDAHFPWTSLDLLKIMAFDRMGVSLKQIAIMLKHEKILELPFPFDYPVATEEEVALVLEYNRNDVDITHKLYERILPQINLRSEIGKLYNVNVMNASDSKMGNIILEHYYQTELGIDTRQLRDLRTKRQNVRLGECIAPTITFQTPQLRELYAKISGTTVHAYEDFKFSEALTYAGITYSLGIGGIHSTEKACRFDGTAETKIISCDIGSMYPTCIIINNIHPEHLDEGFVQVLSTLTAERLAAKKTNKLKADALKITINGLYGKLNSDTFWLEDAKAMLSVTISGQLYILMLIEMLELAGIHCISANTDGIECLVPVDAEKLYYSICEDWEETTGFKLEYIEFAHYIKRDVNNYIAITSEGKVKTKGAFIPDIDLKKGYKHPIIPRAVNEYFIKGVPVEETVRASRDIMDFCISQKTGSEFKLFLHTLQGSTPLQKTNRFYISHHGGTIGKRREKGGGSISLYARQTVRLLNDYDPAVPFEDYDVNVEWYIRQARDLVEEIEPNVVQQDMFAGISDFGHRTKMKIEVPEAAVTRKPKIVKEKDVREAPKTRRTFNVSERFGVVTNIDLKFAPAITVYSLRKGTEVTVKVNKDVYGRKTLRLGDVINMRAFVKKPKVAKTDKGFEEVQGEFTYWLTLYDIIEDFSEFTYNDGRS